MHECVQNLSVAHNKSLRVWFFLLLFFRALRAFGVWFIYTPRAPRSQEAAPPLDSQGSPLQGPSVQDATLKTCGAQKLTPALPSWTRKSATCSWNSGCAGLVDFLLLRLDFLWQLLKIRSDFAWLPLVFKQSHCYYFKQRSTLPLVREKKEATSIFLVAVWCSVQFLVIWKNGKNGGQKKKAYLSICAM